jgi:hypothetical protein
VGKITTAENVGKEWSRSIMKQSLLLLCFLGREEVEGIVILKDEQKATVSWTGVDVLIHSRATMRFAPLLEKYRLLPPSLSLFLLPSLYFPLPLPPSLTLSILISPPSIPPSFPPSIRAAISPSSLLPPVPPSHPVSHPVEWFGIHRGEQIHHPPTNTSSFPSPFILIIYPHSNARIHTQCHSCCPMHEQRGDGRMKKSTPGLTPTSRLALVTAALPPQTASQRSSSSSGKSGYPSHTYAQRTSGAATKLAVD